MAGRVPRLAALALAGALSSACSQSTIPDGSSMFDTTGRGTELGDPAAYVVAPGETFEIRLAANPSTGFAWELGAPLDGAVVRSIATAYEPKVGDRVGAGGISVWKFEGVAPGRATIVLAYRRPWEPEVAPARTATYSVAVD